MARSEQANSEQRSYMVEFMAQNPEMVSKKFSNIFSFETYNRRWAELKSELDKLSPVKDIKVWQKYWNDKRSKVKRKKADKVRSIRETGGGEDETPELTEEEERIVSLIGGDIVIQGDSGVKELGFGPTEMEASTSWQSSPVLDEPYEVVTVEYQI